MFNKVRSLPWSDPMAAARRPSFVCFRHWFLCNRAGSRFWVPVSHSNCLPRSCLLGVVFQTPSLDRKLTVEENLSQQGALYGLHGARFRTRRDEVLRHLGLESRRRELAETLSGGLRRRLDLARGMLHLPRVLLLDEPSTGLDPGARNDLWQYLRQLRTDHGTTIVLTTHLLDEAERADRVAILDLGAIVCLDHPQALCATLGGDSILIEARQPAELAQQIRQRFGGDAHVVDHQVRLTAAAGREWVDRLMEAFTDQIQAIRLGKPTLEDVFIARTGHRFWQESVETLARQ